MPWSWPRERDPVLGPAPGIRPVGVGDARQDHDGARRRQRQHPVGGVPPATLRHDDDRAALQPAGRERLARDELLASAEGETTPRSRSAGDAVRYSAQSSTFRKSPIKASLYSLLRAALHRKSDGVLSSNGYVLDESPRRLGRLDPVPSGIRADHDALWQRMRRDGYLYLPGLLDPADVKAFRSFYFDALVGTGLVDRREPDSVSPERRRWTARRCAACCSTASSPARRTSSSAGIRGSWELVHVVPRRGRSPAPAAYPAAHEPG